MQPTSLLGRRAARWRDATFDTSFWVNAYRAGLLPYVLARFALHYAPEVAVELPDTNPPGRHFQSLARTGMIIEIITGAQHIHEFGVGERAAISVAIEHPGWVLLLDDYRPYTVAVNRGINVTCSPPRAVTLYDEQVFSEEQFLEALARLYAIGTVSPRLLDEAWKRYRS